MSESASSRIIAVQGLQEKLAKERPFLPRTFYWAITFAVPAFIISPLLLDVENPFEISKAHVIAAIGGTVSFVALLWKLRRYLWATNEPENIELWRRQQVGQEIIISNDAIQLAPVLCYEVRKGDPRIKANYVTINFSEVWRPTTWTHIGNDLLLKIELIDSVQPILIRLMRLNDDSSKDIEDWVESSLKRRNIDATEVREKIREQSKIKSWNLELKLSAAALLLLLISIGLRGFIDPEQAMLEILVISLLMAVLIAAVFGKKIRPILGIAPEEKYSHRISIFSWALAQIITLGFSTLPISNTQRETTVEGTYQVASQNRMIYFAQTQAVAGLNGLRIPISDAAFKQIMAGEKLIRLSLGHSILSTPFILEATLMDSESADRDADDSSARIPGSQSKP